MTIGDAPIARGAWFRVFPDRARLVRTGRTSTLRVRPGFPMAKHTVKAGEHLARIALDHGYTNYRYIFDLSDNAELKKARSTPHILVPGDQVFIPEPEPKSDDSAATEQRHTYRVKTDTLTLRIVLRGLDDKPVKQQECTLDVDGAPVKVQTDGEGTLERNIPHDASSGRLTADNESIGLEVDAPIVIGGLQPVDTVHGQIARLNNLGYFAGNPDAPPGAPGAPGKKPDPEAELRFRSAVEEFQCDHGLKVDGKCGAATQAKLKEVHGC